MFSTREAAAYLGISMYYLRNMRHGLHAYDGPEFYYKEIDNRRTCVYTKEALDRWKLQHKFKDAKRNTFVQLELVYD